MAVLYLWNTIVETAKRKCTKKDNKKTKKFTEWKIKKRAMVIGYREVQNTPKCEVNSSSSGKEEHTQWTRVWTLY